LLGPCGLVCLSVAVEWSKRTQGATPAFIELLLGTDFANSNSSTRPQYSRPLDRSACRQRTWLPPARGSRLLEGNA